MHRAAPTTAATRAFSAGGVRSVVEKADDKSLMQTMGGEHMKGEKNDKIESPQNYGFTSVVMPADKDKQGNVTEAAEAFISFMGGNRSFPVCQVMDDRRYRLKELEAGDTAFYDHLQQQFHFNKDGGFLTGRDDKKLRFQLVEKPQEQQQSGGNQASTLAEGDTGKGDASQGSKKKKGQTARYKKESKKFVDINKNSTDVEHDGKINVKAGGAVVIKGSSISHKGVCYFDSDVHILGKLRVMEGYKPGNDVWLAGSPSGGPSLLNENIAGDPDPLSPGAEAYVARRRALGSAVVQGLRLIAQKARAQGRENIMLGDIEGAIQELMASDEV